MGHVVRAPRGRTLGSEIISYKASKKLYRFVPLCFCEIIRLAHGPHTGFLCTLMEPTSVLSSFCCCAILLPRKLLQCLFIRSALVLSWCSLCLRSLCEILQHLCKMRPCNLFW